MKLEHFIFLFGTFVLVMAQIPSFHSLRHINLVSLILCLAYSACATAASIYIGKKNIYFKVLLINIITHAVYIYINIGYKMCNIFCWYSQEIPRMHLLGTIQSTELKKIVFLVCSVLFQSSLPRIRAQSCLRYRFSHPLH